jgi:hypothetical protein
LVGPEHGELGSPEEIIGLFGEIGEVGDPHVHPYGAGPASITGPTGGAAYGGRADQREGQETGYALEHAHDDSYGFWVKRNRVVTQEYATTRFLKPGEKLLPEGYHLHGPALDSPLGPPQV